MIQARQRATQALDEVRHRAKLAEVECNADPSADEQPYRGIIEAAERNGCDQLLMVSQRWSGFRDFLLGSETHKVLAHSKIPGLDYRQRAFRAGERSAAKRLRASPGNPVTSRVRRRLGVPTSGIPCDFRDPSRLPASHPAEPGAGQLAQERALLRQEW